MVEDSGTDMGETLEVCFAAGFSGFSFNAYSGF